MEIKRYPSIFYIYFSLIIHAYLIFFLLSSPSISRKLKQMLTPVKTEQEEKDYFTLVDTILDTKEEKTDTTFLSNHNNVSSSPQFSEKEEYNFYNPKTGIPIPNEKNQKEDQSEKMKKNKGDFSLEETVEQTKEKKLNEKDIPVGSPSPSFLEDTSKKMNVQMSMEGPINLGTRSEEVASYFLLMREKIIKEYYTFFPQMQHYMGLLPSGEIVVTFEINKEGYIVNPRITKSFNYEVLDNAALNAVKYANFVGPLPDSLQEKEKISIHFSFVYYNPKD